MNRWTKWLLVSLVVLLVLAGVSPQRAQASWGSAAQSSSPRAGRRDSNADRSGSYGQSRLPPATLSGARSTLCPERSSLGLGRTYRCDRGLSSSLSPPALLLPGGARIGQSKKAVQSGRPCLQGLPGLLSPPGNNAYQDFYRKTSASLVLSGSSRYRQNRCSALAIFAGCILPISPYLAVGQSRFSMIR